MIVVGFGLLALAIAMAAVAVRSSRAYSDWTLHTVEVEARLADAQTLFERAESARRGYLVRPDPRFLEAHAEVASTLPQTLDEVARLTADNPSQAARVAELRDLLTRRAAARDRSLALAGGGPGALAQARSDFGGPAASRDVLEVRRIIGDMQAEERRLLEIRDEARRLGQDRVNWALGATAALMFLLAVGSVVTLRRHTDDLARSRDALRQLNVGLEDAVSARTADLRRANEEIQRFAYIVSHDLRSPLVNVMGFTSEIEAALPSLRSLLEEADQRQAGLVSADARQAVTEDLPEAVGFIRTSTSKMDRLINAILRLSREGRRTMQAEPLNMQVLLDNVAAGARARADAAGATVTVQWPMPDIVGDRLVLEQIFGNLVDNALKYLQPGRRGRVLLRGRAEVGRLIYEVEDNGRGIDPRDHERVFELFRRAGSQDQPGEGIGLAHVRALVYRLGGTITVESELGGGAVFRVSLPPRPPFEQDRAA